LLPSVLFVAGFVLFSRVAIAPFDTRRLRPGELLVPPSCIRLSSALQTRSGSGRREGIQWNDSVGLTLARRVNPDVTFLGPDANPRCRYYLSVAPLPVGNAGALPGETGCGGNGMFDTTSRLLARYGVQQGVSALDGIVNGWMLLALVGTLDGPSGAR
jgi:hypothetical protein